MQAFPDARKAKKTPKYPSDAPSSYNLKVPPGITASMTDAMIGVSFLNPKTNGGSLEGILAAAEPFRYKKLLLSSYWEWMNCRVQAATEKEADKYEEADPRVLKSKGTFTLADKKIARLIAQVNTLLWLLRHSSILKKQLKDGKQDEFQTRINALFQGKHPIENFYDIVKFDIVLEYCDQLHTYIGNYFTHKFNPDFLSQINKMLASMYEGLGISSFARLTKKDCETKEDLFKAINMKVAQVVIEGEPEIDLAKFNVHRLRALRIKQDSEALDYAAINRNLTHLVNWFNANAANKYRLLTTLTVEKHYLKGIPHRERADSNSLEADTSSGGTSPRDKCDSDGSGSETEDGGDTITRHNYEKAQFYEGKLHAKLLAFLQAAKEKAHLNNLIEFPDDLTAASITQLMLLYTEFMVAIIKHKHAAKDDSLVNFRAANADDILSAFNALKEEYPFTEMFYKAVKTFVKRNIHNTPHGMHQHYTEAACNYLLNEVARLAFAVHGHERRNYGVFIYPELGEFFDGIRKNMELPSSMMNPVEVQRRRSRKSLSPSNSSRKLTNGDKAAKATTEEEAIPAKVSSEEITLDSLLNEEPYSNLGRTKISILQCLAVILGLAKMLGNGGDHGVILDELITQCQALGSIIEKDETNAPYLSWLSTKFPSILSKAQSNLTERDGKKKLTGVFPNTIWTSANARVTPIFTAYTGSSFFGPAQTQRLLVAAENTAHTLIDMMTPSGPVLGGKKKI